MSSTPPPLRFSGDSSSPRRYHPRCRVVLLHPTEQQLHFIIATLMELTHYAKAEATHRMWEAVHFGRSLVLITHLERGELYQEQFAARGLPVMLEPA